MSDCATWQNKSIEVEQDVIISGNGVNEDTEKSVRYTENHLNLVRAWATYYELGGGEKQLETFTWVAVKQNNNNKTYKFLAQEPTQRPMQMFVCLQL